MATVCSGLWVPWSTAHAAIPSGGCEESLCCVWPAAPRCPSPFSLWQASGAVIQCCRVASCPQHGRTLGEHVPHSHAPSVCHCHTSRLCLLADAACAPASHSTYNPHQSTLFCKPLQSQELHQLKASCLMQRHAVFPPPNVIYFYLWQRLMKFIISLII